MEETMVGKEELKIVTGPRIALRARHRIGMSNQKQKLPGADTGLLIFAPAAASIVFEGETGEDIGCPLENESYDSNEPRVPAGQPGGGQWTSAGAGGMQQGKRRLQMAPSTPLLSGGNARTVGASAQDLPPDETFEEYLGDVAEVWKGYGDAIAETVSGLWNAAAHPVDTGKSTVQGIARIVKDPVGTLKAIGRQIADDFTSGDPRKAGKLVGQVLISLAGTELSAEKLATLLPKVEAAAAGEAVSFTAEEREIVQRVMSGEESLATKEQELIGKGSSGTPNPNNDPGWKFGSTKSLHKWQNQMKQRGWTEDQITEAIQNGDLYPAQNKVNPSNGATRYVNPTTGQSIVQDDITGEIIHIGGPGFKY